MTYAASDQIDEASFRGWAEIVKNGRRMARSGLIGPRFVNVEAAQQYALDWGRQWIDRHCAALAAAEVERPRTISNATTEARDPVALAQD